MMFIKQSIEFSMTSGGNKIEKTVKISEGFFITKAKDSDIKDILEIEKLSFKGPWSEDMFRSELRNRVSSFYTLRDSLDDNLLVGYVVFWIVYGEAQILNIVIHPNYKKRGLGRKLLDFAIDKMKSQNAYNIFLEVRDSNKIARGLYERSGFTEIGVRHNYYGDEDAIVMKLDL